MNYVNVRIFHTQLVVFTNGTYFNYIRICTVAFSFTNKVVSFWLYDGYRSMNSTE